jgi:RNA-directed DNA polymerase
MTRKLVSRVHRKSRNTETYAQTALFDRLHAQSKSGAKFRNLYDLVVSPENIKLAYRNIRKNKGSKTAGMDGKTMRSLEKRSVSQTIRSVQKLARDFKPATVKRVWIPKPNGKKRPIGIPSIADRLLQQCFLQILEPICEAKFHPHSYGFRPGRSTHHALARAHYLVNAAHLHYVVDMDIHSFFDSISHGKLLKQFWTLGIQDKKVLSVLSKMLKAPIAGEGVQHKGTPQGGILSPLFSNVALNELDWWLSNQWQTFQTKKAYKTLSGRLKGLKNSNLKEFYLVRYADDFKIFCRTHQIAERIFEATKKWLADRLNLTVSVEKSKITKLRKKWAEFLGVRLKAVFKKSKFVCQSTMSSSALQRVFKTLKEAIKQMQRHPSVQMVNKFNAKVLGLQNYFSCATQCNNDFGKLGYILGYTLYNRLKTRISNQGEAYAFFKKRYPGKFKHQFIAGIPLFPVWKVTHDKWKLAQFSQGKSPYTKEGREKMHTALSDSLTIDLQWIGSHPLANASLEYNDNRMSSWVAQKGKCFLTGSYVGTDFHCHHKTPKAKGGTDSCSNLVIVSPEMHRLIHATSPTTLQKYRAYLAAMPRPMKSRLARLNQLRTLAGIHPIV